MTTRSLKNSRGFTLFEILVSLVLLAAVGVIALNSFNNSNRITLGKQNTAANLGRQTLEDLKNAVRDDWWAVAVGSRLSPTTPGPQPPITPLDGIDFTRAYTVTGVDLDGDGTDDLRRATTTVTWTPAP